MAVPRSTKNSFLIFFLNFFKHMFRNINDSLTDKISSCTNSMSYPGEVDMSMSSVTAGYDSQSSTNFSLMITSLTLMKLKLLQY